MWQCKRCSQTLHKAFYSKWLEAHTTHKTNLVRCDSYTAVEEQQQTHEQANTYAMVMPQDTTTKHSQRQTILQQ